mmetsp:Transcript_15888/g.36155  ORF Transcript_15888/g.36155 Transcript_15888/m.36155 type:complete len:307 (+) Transcript_15888:2139-3059(+)
MRGIVRLCLREPRLAVAWRTEDDRLVAGSQLRRFLWLLMGQRLLAERQGRRAAGEGEARPFAKAPLPLLSGRSPPALACTEKEGADRRNHGDGDHQARPAAIIARLCYRGEARRDEVECGRLCCRGDQTVVRRVEERAAAIEWHILWIGIKADLRPKDLQLRYIQRPTVSTANNDITTHCVELHLHSPLKPPLHVNDGRVFTLHQALPTRHRTLSAPYRPHRRRVIGDGKVEVTQVLLRTDAVPKANRVNVVRRAQVDEEPRLILRGRVREGPCVVVESEGTGATVGSGGLEARLLQRDVAGAVGF